MPDLIREQTLQWVKKIIIGENFCPFAKPVVDNNELRIAVVESSETEQILHQIFDEILLLDAEKNIETTLVVIPALKHFEDFLDVVDYLQTLIDEQGYSGIYQLAHFHPHYCFEGVAQTAAENYTNRSPYPSIHLLREASIEKALKSFPFPEKIPQRNIEHAQKLGGKHFKSVLRAIAGVGKH